MNKSRKKPREKRKANESTSKGTKSEYPFIVHACEEIPAFPTHTHGLTEIGWPEFIMDPFAFGPSGNGMRINRAYEYFRRAENVAERDIW